MRLLKSYLWRIALCGVSLLERHLEKWDWDVWNVMLVKLINKEMKIFLKYLRERPSLCRSTLNRRNMFVSIFWNTSIYRGWYRDWKNSEEKEKNVRAHKYWSTWSRLFWCRNIKRFVYLGQTGSCVLPVYRIMAKRCPLTVCEVHLLFTCISRWNYGIDVP